MSNSDDRKQEESVKIVLEKIDKKMDELSKILQKFGLDLITKFGKTTHTIKYLSDKIEDLDKATIEIKGLTPQLIKIIDNQNTLEMELELIKSLIQSNITHEKSEIIERDVSITEIKQSISNQLSEFMFEMDNMEDIQLIKTYLESIKHKIFTSIGGSKIPYEISQVINLLNDKNTLTENLKNNIKEKIGFWINRL